MRQQLLRTRARPGGRKPSSPPGIRNRAFARLVCDIKILATKLGTSHLLADTLNGRIHELQSRECWSEGFNLPITSSIHTGRPLGSGQIPKVCAFHLGKFSLTRTPSRALARPLCFHNAISQTDPGKTLLPQRPKSVAVISMS